MEVMGLCISMNPSMSNLRKSVFPDPDHSLTDKHSNIKFWMLFLVATIFCFHPSQILLKYISDIYGLKKIPAGILFT